jgi:dUTP pyrophosphatase
VNVARVRIFRVRGVEDKDVPPPTKSTEGSSGYDLYAAVDSPVEIEPGARIAIRTGYALAIPPGFEGQVRPRSGLALHHGVTLINAPGTIDSDYRGELHVILWNAGRDSFVVKRGDRIGQLVIAAVAEAEWEEVESPEALGATPRGDGGFGHTGRR